MALVAFAYMASAHDRFPGEVAAASWVQSWRTSWLDTAMKAISPDHRLVTAPLVVVVALALFLKGMRTESGLIVAATMVSFVTLVILKAAIARPRPPAERVRVIEEADGYSFPSGHVTHYVVFLGTLAFVLSTSVKPGVNRWLIQGAVLAVLMVIGLSRVYLGVHWPSDVLGGYAVGAVVAAGTIWVWLRWTGSTRPSARSDEAV